jgi:hypothetical protein
MRSFSTPASVSVDQKSVVPLTVASSDRLLSVVDFDIASHGPAHATAKFPNISGFRGAAIRGAGTPPTSTASFGRGNRQSKRSAAAHHVRLTSAAGRALAAATRATSP